MNEAFYREDDQEKVQYLTAAVFGYFRMTGDLIFTSSGHSPGSLVPRRKTTWDWREEIAPYRQTTVEGIPLGLIPGTHYL
jgi:hypothetical protein